MQDRGPVTTRCLEGQVQRVGNVLGAHVGAQLPGDDVARVSDATLGSSQSSRRWVSWPGRTMCCPEPRLDHAGGNPALCCEAQAATARRHRRRQAGDRQQSGGECLRGTAVGCKNWIFAGADCGGRRAAAMYSLLKQLSLAESTRRSDWPMCSIALAKDIRSTESMSCYHEIGYAEPE